MIDNRTIQLFLKSKGVYLGKIDGVFGPGSRAALDKYLTSQGMAAKWSDSRKHVAIQQIIMRQAEINPGKVIDIDGIAGPVFQYALELWQNRLRDLVEPTELIAHQPPVWPRQADIRKFYGEPGTNQAMLVSPYPLYLDWDLSVSVKRFSIHEKCHDSALRAMQRILDHYGPEAINRLGLDQFGGCLNVRKMRGGNAMSMHSWGIAIDWDANRNPLRASSKTALMAKPEYAPFLDLWAEEGWISLGREKNYDWMHLQAARL